MRRSWIYWLSALVSFSETTNAAAVQNGGSQPQLIQPLSSGIPILDSTAPTNTPGPVLSLASLNGTSAENDYELTCDGSKYGGYNLDVDDCLSALSRFIRSRNSITFAERDSPHLTDDMFPLPWRWMGGISYLTREFSTNGRLTLFLVKGSCYIQPILRPWAETGSSSLYKIRDAAYDLTMACALRQKQGGMVTNIGKC